MVARHGYFALLKTIVNGPPSMPYIQQTG